MRRIYFLLPDLKTAGTVTDELLLARIEERHIHVIAREGTELGDLPKASLLQTSDVIPTVERGLAVGGATGILAGVAADTFPPAGVVLGGGAILAHNTSWPALEERVAGDPFVAENVVQAQISEIAASRCDTAWRFCSIDVIAVQPGLRQRRSDRSARWSAASPAGR